MSELSPFSLRPLTMEQEAEVLNLYKEYYFEADFYSGYFAEYLQDHPAIGLYDAEKLLGFCLSRKFAPDILEIA